MTTIRNSQVLRVIPFLISICLSSFPVHAKYSGGMGEPNDPYKIATVEDLILLGETPEDYDKHFILTADIDLDPNLPGRKVFDKAVFAAFTNIGRWSIQLIPFVGVFDGNGHTISHLTIEGNSNLGLFHQLGFGAEVINLSLVDVSVSGLGEYIGGLTGSNGSYNSDGGLVTRCHSTGTVTGSRIVGGLVGDNFGSITSSYSTCTVRGGSFVGGLIGGNGVTDYPVSGILTNCYSSGTVSGERYVGGLAGYSHGSITTCYSIGTVAANEDVGGLVGQNWGGSIINSYSTAVVSGDHYVGGLAGRNYYGAITNSYSNGLVIGNNEVGGLVGDIAESSITMSFWDIETSGQTSSDGGTGKTTAEMQTAITFLNVGWDFVDETINGPNDIWEISEDLDYPRLCWEKKYSGGTGEPKDPYQIATAEDLMLLGESPEDYDKNFILTVDIDLDPNLPGRKVFERAVIAPDMNDTDFYYDFQGIPFSGAFNGNGHTISHLTIDGIGNLGLFGQLHEQAVVSNVGLTAVDVNGVFTVGAIVADNSGGNIADSYSNGLVNGNWFVGGLAGDNSVGSITGSWSTGVVMGKGDVGGLVGRNGESEGSVAILTDCYSTATVSGGYSVGGLAGSNYYKGRIATSYSTGVVAGIRDVGGLVGYNFNDVTQSNSTATVSGDQAVGGFVGTNWNGNITMSYSSSDVSGEDWTAGGLVGYNRNGSIATSYSSGTVNGNRLVGGLVGYNEESSINTSYSSDAVTGHGYIGGLVGYNEASNITMSYSSGLVTGNEDVGGLVAFNNGSIISSFWDMESSGLTTSVGGTGLTTVEMQTTNTFLNAGWDFVDETENGAEDIWWIDEGNDYPRLWWKLTPEN